MKLAPCPFRRVASGHDEMHCELVQQVIGLPDFASGSVEAAACSACEKRAPPSANRLNEVVASLIYNDARRFQHGNGRSAGELGQAWQAERYALNSLANESSGHADELRTSPLSSVRTSFERFAARRRVVRKRSRSPVIGLAGFGAASGLGYLNRDLAEHGAVDAWLRIDRLDHSTDAGAVPSASVLRVDARVADTTVRRWLRELDWVVWAEASPLDALPRLARQAGVRVACVPMWEWTSPTDDWLRLVDLLICPTMHAYRMFKDWRRRFGFDWRVAYFPWPVAVDRFLFRRREICKTFLFVNGHGGAWARGLDMEARLGPRKGLDAILSTARLTPEVDWKIYSQVDVDFPQLDNVEVCTGPADHEHLYLDGDVCIQPSRWEGLGLQFLECQAAGMPLVTVDVAPMNEYRALRTAPIADFRCGYLRDAQPISVPELDPSTLASIVRELRGSDIREASLNAHQWIRAERSWNQAANRWRQLFEPDDGQEQPDVRR